MTEASDIGLAMAWHGRLMVLSWVLLVPSAIMLARFFKVTPKQNWPQQKDNQFWWQCHLWFQYSAALLTLIAVMLILSAPNDLLRHWLVHRLLGWSTVVLCCMQVLSGWLRGSKGGPTDLHVDGSFFGHHYFMSTRRLVFEYVHKTNGYILLFVSCMAIQSGLLAASAPKWMAIIVGVWWLCWIGVFMYLQRNGYHVDTYAAIWGHPYNKNKLGDDV